MEEGHTSTFSNNWKDILQIHFQIRGYQPSELIVDEGGGVHEGNCPVVVQTGCSLGTKLKGAVAKTCGGRKVFFQTLMLPQYDLGLN